MTERWYTIFATERTQSDMIRDGDHSFRQMSFRLQNRRRPVADGHVNIGFVPYRVPFNPIRTERGSGREIFLKAS